MYSGGKVRHLVTNSLVAVGSFNMATTMLAATSWRISSSYVRKSITSAGTKRAAIGAATAASVTASGAALSPLRCALQ